MATSVLVDDSDPRITYGPNWQVGFLGNGSPGSFYNRTFHQLESSGAGGTVSFQFEGISFKIGGSAFFQSFSSSSNTGKVPPSPFNCTVDSAVLPVTSSQGEGLGSLVCEADNLPNGVHIVNLVIASNSTQQPQLFLDYIIFTPLSESPDSPRPNDTLFLPFDSPQINTSNGWSFPGGDQGATATSATLSVNYTGQSITWFNCPNENNVDATPSTASYNIDNGTTLSSFSVVDNTVPVLFSVMLNSPGPHELQVSYSGTQKQNELTFCGLGISPSPINDFRGIALPNPPIQNGTNSTTPGSSPSGLPSEKKSHTAVIAGVVAAVLVLAAICVLGGLLFKRRRKQKERVYQSRFVDGRDY